MKAKDLIELLQQHNQEAEVKYIVGGCMDLEFTKLHINKDDKKDIVWIDAPYT